MERNELPFLTIAELAKLIASRDVSPVEVVKASLERIDRLDGDLNAFITVTGDDALQAAQTAERDILSGSYRGPLHGIPVSLKDLFWTKGTRTTSGSKIFSDFVPRENATVVERLGASGAILVGKTNMHEFAYGTSTNNPHFGPTRNPWDRERIPGGSSGGSGAAVSASLCIASLGTDTGGSIRIPSSLCGIVGIKPTYGRVSRFGVTPLAWSLDHVGPMTKCVEDAAIVLTAIAGDDPKDVSSTQAPVPDYAAGLDGVVRGLRLGVPREYFFSGLEPDVETAVRAALETLQGLGAELVEFSLPDLRYGPSVQAAILQSEATAYHRLNLASRPADYGEDVRLRLQMGQLVTATQYIDAQRARARLVQSALDLFESLDAIVTPTLPMTAPKISETMPASAGGREAEVRRNLTGFTSPFNFLGLPAISVPCGFSTDGLPIGLQIASKPFAEMTALRIAHAYEQSTPWHLRRSPVE